MNDYNEIIKFVDDMVLAKSHNVDELADNLETVRRFLELKGPLDRNVLDYLDAIMRCANEIISIKRKGVKMSTDSFFQNKERREEIVPQRRYHYDSVC